MTGDLFFQLSGEHRTLPAAEVLAILESERFEYECARLASKLLTLKANPQCVHAVAERSAMCEAAGNLIFRCADEERIPEAVSEISFSRFVEQGSSFSVKVSRILGSSRHLSRLRLQSEIGDAILRSVPQSYVDLNEPDHEFVGMIGEGYFALGLLTARRQNQGEDERKPKQRPAFHPSTMMPRLARCLVNLARAREGAILLDPFCGVGGILIEAGMMGCRILGSDLDLRMLRSASKNIKHFNLDPDGLALSDARSLPYTKAPSIATDPPYGREASTMGSDPRRLLKDFLAEVHSILSRDGYLCLAGPVAMDIRQLGLEAGLDVFESHVIRVHRSLAREIVVLGPSRRQNVRRPPWNSYS